MIQLTETARLILREMLPGDEAGLFELDRDPDVHRYLGNQPIGDLSEARDIIAFIRQQYADHGIGRYAVIEKDTNAFVGWCGLKFVTSPVNGHDQFYDLGYRFIKRYWGRGYATESSIAWLTLGFEKLNLKNIYAMAEAGNKDSQHVLLKSGLKFVNQFDLKGATHHWFKISRNEWLERTQA